MSNLITLAGATHADAQLAAIRSMIEVDRMSEFSVKDGFQCLGLAALGFDVLFHATWIYRAPGAELPEDEPGLAWSVVSNPAELAEWEQTWRGTTANADARGRTEIFLPSLLRDANFHFLLGRRNAVSVATAALNRSSDVVGISNVFSGDESAGPLFPGAVRLAARLYPSLPIVGYERGASLFEAQRVGFEPLGGLTVWVRSRV
jgi:hypothetical protein